MKTFKKLTALVLALGMMSCFAACETGNGGTNSDNGGSESNGGQTNVNVGEDVTEKQFNDAIEALYSAKNFSATMKMVESVENRETTYTVKCADDKMYMVADVVTNGVPSKQYAYIGKVDNVCYIWRSMDNQEWERHAFSVKEGVDPTSGEQLFSEVFDWCNNFQYHEYNKATGMHEFNPFGGPTIYAMVSNGKIIKYRSEDSENDWSEATITYGGATVGALPVTE
jgi:hypothetical protein